MEKTIRYYLGLDENGYLTYLSSVGEGPYIETLDGYDFSGYRLRAHRWDGETLAFDPARYAVLAKEEAREAAQEKIAEYRSRIHRTDDVVLSAVEGLFAANTVTGFLAALLEASAAIRTTLAERAELRRKIHDLEG